MQQGIFVSSLILTLSGPAKLFKIIPDDFVIQTAIKVLESVSFCGARLGGYTLQEGWLDVLQPYNVRRELPLQSSYNCHPLPHVIGPTVSEYYEVIRLPNSLQVLSRL